MKGFKKDGKFIPTGNKSKSSLTKKDIAEHRDKKIMGIDCGCDERKKKIKSFLHKMETRKDESIDEFEVDTTPIREYNRQKDTPSGKTSGWHQKTYVTGTIAERLRGGNDSRAFTQEKHFTRCELKNGLKSCPEDREHLYAVAMTHPYELKQALEKDRIMHQCVFCGDEWDKRTGGLLRSEEPDYGQVVEDVSNNDLVREEAKIRNISLSHYELDQESMEPDKFVRKRKEELEKSNAEYKWKQEHPQ